MSEQVLVALDQGTSSTRAIVFDKSNLLPLHIAQRELTQHYPDDGYVEHDLEEIWAHTKEVLAEAGSWVKANNFNVAALGITNQRETIALWDKETGKPIHKAIVWQDRRTADYCEKLKQDGVFELVNSKTGLLLDPYFSASKLRWLLDHTGSYTRNLAEQGTLLAGTIDSFLLWRLTEKQVHATDVTNASRTQLCALDSLDWDDELLKLHDIPRACLPKIMDNVDDFGVTDALNLGKKIPIGGIAGDQQSAAIGQACLSKGATKVTFGTGCFVIVQGDDKPIIPGNGLLGTVGYRVNDRVAYAIEGSIFIAGMAVKWLRDQLKLIETAAQSEKIAASQELSEHLYLVPAFTGLGAPYWNPNARAAIVGMTLDTTSDQIVQATLASIVYSTYDLNAAFTKEGIAPSQLNLDGGMAVNNWFAQLLADVNDVAVCRPKCIETTAIGAAFLAGVHAGLYADIEEISNLRVVDNNFYPTWDKEKRERMLAGWARAVDTVIHNAKSINPTN